MPFSYLYFMFAVYKTLLSFQIKTTLRILLIPFIFSTFFGLPHLRGPLRCVDSTNPEIEVNSVREYPLLPVDFEDGYYESINSRLHKDEINIDVRNLKKSLSSLRGMCFDFLVVCNEFDCPSHPDLSTLGWSYLWCYRQFVKRMRIRHISNINGTLLIDISQREVLGFYDQHLSPSFREEIHGGPGESRAVVSIQCCKPSNPRNVSVQFSRDELWRRTEHLSVSSAEQAQTDTPFVLRAENSTDGLNVHLIACVPSLCHEEVNGPVHMRRTLASDERLRWRLARRQGSGSSRKAEAGHGADNTKVMDGGRQRALLDRVRNVFTHAYDSYMTHAFPAAELRPLSCVGGPFELVKIPMVTLIDSMDTLIIMGNRSEFNRAVQLVVTSLPNFNMDVNVSLFETTIRILGGLLSAHLFAVDPTIPLGNGRDSAVAIDYDGRSLLTLAIDLGNRLLPAFDTKTKIPYGTVNLMHGVPDGETKIASTAGAGSLLLEFEVLSRLSGDDSFGQAALLSMKSLYKRKSSVGLIGKHINTETGAWHEALSGIGSNSDSFYEYMLKSHLLFRRKELFRMFSESYVAIKKHVLADGHWFTEVDMFTGKMQRRRVENLNAFWPGMEASLGFTEEAAKQLNALYAVWTDVGYLPEEFDYSQWLQGSELVNSFYPLRPELIESTYHHYRTTGDRTWLTAGLLFLESIENSSRTDCGFASLSSSNRQKHLQDQMPSFFLSETCKYLYLLFDEQNFIHSRPYIFSTEAHPFDSVQVFLTAQQRQSNMQIAQVQKSIANSSNSSSSNNYKSVAKKSNSIIANADAQRRFHSTQTERSLLTIPKVSTSIGARESLRPKGQVAGSKGGNLLDKLLRVVDLHKERQRQLEFQRQQEEKEKEKQRNFELKRSIVESSRDSEYSLLPSKCRKATLWDSEQSYQPQYMKKSFQRQSKQSRNRLHLVIALVAQVSDHILEEKQHVTTAQRVRVVRRDVCRIGDQPNKKQVDSAATRPGDAMASASQAAAAALAAAAAAATKEAGLLRTVDVNMGPLGDFEVKVYSDGFVVQNKEDLSLAEISNIGKSVVLVRDSGPETKSKDGNDKKREIISSVRTVIATTTGLVRTCSVQVVTAAPDFYTETVVWERSCSLANFGSSSTNRIQSAVAIPHFDSEHMCHLPTEAAEEDRVVSEGEPEPAKRKWWQWGTYPYPPPTKTEHDTHSGSQPKRSPHHTTIHGSIVLARRGDCLFEEKAILAQRLGAKALVVRNTEEQVFIMAGKREVDAAEATSVVAPLLTGTLGKLLSRGTSDRKQSRGTSEEKLVIPTVMVTRSDGDDLAQFFKPGVAPSLQMRLLVESESIIFNSEFFGNFYYPKVWISRTVVYVISRGNWGTFLTSTGTGSTEGTGDWQLYLMSKKDMANPQMVPLVELPGQYSAQSKTLISTVVSNPVEMYRYLVGRRCPHVFHVSDDITAGSGREDGSGFGTNQKRYKLRSKPHHKTSSKYRMQQKHPE